MEWAKATVLAQCGEMTCEVCNFNYKAVHGMSGEGFIECHHKKPLSMLVPGYKTRLEDLALVCANCHRMLHRGKVWQTIESLKRLMIA